MRRRTLLTLAAAASCTLLAGPASTPAHATLYGFESNAELVNSNVTEAQRASTLTGMRQAGGQVVRVNFGWNELAAGCAGQSVLALKNHNNTCYTWDAFDQVARMARARNMQVLATVSRAPQWLLGSSNPSFLGNSNAQWMRSVRHYEAFMFAAARRYRAGSDIGHVRMWTVWNEPNSHTFLAPQLSTFQQRRTAARYAQLLARTAVQIKKANRFALVAAGPTGPTGGKFGTPPIIFLARVQMNLSRFLPGAGIFERRWIDAWAHNPYPGFNVAPSKGRLKSPKVGMTNIRDLFTRLDRHPALRRKPVWVTEFGWETNPPEPTLGISAALQGRFMGEAFDWLDRTRRVPVVIWYGFRDTDSIVGDWQSGVLYLDGRRKFSYYWFQRPISVNTTRVRRGRTVRVFARSAVRPTRTRIAWSTNGRTWRLLPQRGRRRDGSQVQNVRIYRTTWFATWDGTRGPSRIVRAN